MQRIILITGASGKIGTALVRWLDDHKSSDYRLRLADLEKGGSRGVALDITDPEACRAACQGVDAVVHLAGIASPDASFEALLPVNVVGTYNILRAAAGAGVRRVVLAGSAQVIEGYPLDRQIGTGMPVRPKNLYGVSKAFAEALAAYFAGQEALETVVVRIGAFEYPEHWRRMGARDLSAWISPADLCALLVRCLEADLGAEKFAVVHGVSNNRYKRLDLTDTCALLGYAPTDDAFQVWSIGLDESSEPAV